MTSFILDPTQFFTRLHEFERILITLCSSLIIDRYWYALSFSVSTTVDASVFLSFFVALLGRHVLGIRHLKIYCSHYTECFPVRNISNNPFCIFVLVRLSANFALEHKNPILDISRALQLSMSRIILPIYYFNSWLLANAASEYPTIRILFWSREGIL